MILLFFVLVALKMSGVLQCSWLWVTAPLWVLGVMVMAVMMIYIIIVSSTLNDDEDNDDEDDDY